MKHKINVYDKVVIFFNRIIFNAIPREALKTLLKVALMGKFLQLYRFVQVLLLRWVEA